MGRKREIDVTLCALYSSKSNNNLMNSIPSYYLKFYIVKKIQMCSKNSFLNLLIQLRNNGHGNVLHAKNNHNKEVEEIK
jgi:hypothetical protein